MTDILKSSREKFSPREPESARHQRLAMARNRLLEDFVDNPDDEEVWQTAYDAALKEDSPASAALLVDHRYPTIDIPAMELVELAERVRNAQPRDRYELMTQEASNGKLWFDILRTFSSDQLAQARYDFIESLSGWNNFENALDLGTGTGKSLASIEPFANNVVGLERNADLLNVAQEIAADNTELVRADVVSLPFADNTFDLVASAGLTVSLDEHTAVEFYSELARVMNTGGIYIEASYFLNERGEFGDELAAITASSKATLADMIVDTVSGKLALSSFLSREGMHDLLGELGLDIEYVPITPDENNSTVITVVTKL